MDTSETAPKSNDDVIFDKEICLKATEDQRPHDVAPKSNDDVILDKEICLKATEDQRPHDVVSELDDLIDGVERKIKEEPQPYEVSFVGDDGTKEKYDEKFTKLLNIMNEFWSYGHEKLHFWQTAYSNESVKNVFLEKKVQHLDKKVRSLEEQLKAKEKREIEILYEFGAQKKQLQDCESYMKVLKSELKTKDQLLLQTKEKLQGLRDTSESDRSSKDEEFIFVDSEDSDDSMDVEDGTVNPSSGMEADYNTEESAKQHRKSEVEQVKKSEIYKAYLICGQKSGVKTPDHEPPCHRVEWLEEIDQWKIKLANEVKGSQRR